MYRIFISICVLLCAILKHASDLGAVTISTVPVNDAGNAADQDYGPGQFGAVPYEFRIGAYEVTNVEYAEFLDAKAKSDPLGFYSEFMASDPRSGITRSGLDGSYDYEVKPNMGNKPVNYVNFYDAIRFANWLHNGQDTGDTETGAYTLGPIGGDGVPINEAEVGRNPGATWVLPTENEWYKAAYYDPRDATQGGPPGDDNYWFFPTMSDDPPAIAAANGAGDISNPGPNVANHNLGANWNGKVGNVTTVGSGGAVSFYGTFDQGGNVVEWNEQLFEPNFRGVRGGGWNVIPDSLSAAYRPFGASAALYEGADTGFRVALVPEPSTLALAGIGAIALLGRASRRRANARTAT